MNWEFEREFERIKNGEYEYDFVHNLINEAFGYWNPLFEDEHINYRMSGVADSLDNLFSKDLPVSRLINKRYYSGWYYDVESMCCGESVGVKGHPIYFNFYNVNDDRYAFVIMRQFSGDSESIEIFINLNDFVREIDINRKYAIYLDIKSSVEHELNHTFDMFVLPDRDVSSSKKNSIYEDVCSVGNEFSINPDDYNFIIGLCYFLSPNERRAHLKGMSSYLEKNFTNHAFLIQYSNSLKNYTIRHKITNAKDIDTKCLVISLLSMAVLRAKSKLSEFREMKNDFTDELIKKNGQKFKDKKRTDSITLVLGYYMLKHNMLDFSLNDKVRGREIRNYFKRDNVCRIINTGSSVDYEMMELIRENVHNVYLDYERRIYYECERQANKHVDDVLKMNIERAAVQKFVELSTEDVLNR